MTFSVTRSHTCMDFFVVDDNDFDIEAPKKILIKKFGLTCDITYNGVLCLGKIKQMFYREVLRELPGETFQAYIQGM